MHLKNQWKTNQCLFCYSICIRAWCNTEMHQYRSKCIVCRDPSSHMKVIDDIYHYVPWLKVPYSGSLVLALMYMYPCLDSPLSLQWLICFTTVLICDIKLVKQCLIFSFLSLSCAVSFVLLVSCQVRPLPLLLSFYHGHSLHPRS